MAIRDRGKDVWEIYELFYLALTTGMRQGELLGLHWKDVDLDGKMQKLKHTP